jgi:UDP-N-acetyl-D-mannosaminuronate dehydrogenase/intein/homing endonuclease
MKTARMIELIDRIVERRATVGVIGLGYVGLPLAVEFARSGFQVLGFEVSAEKIDQINGGVSYIQDVPGDQIAPLAEAGRLRATGDFAELGACDAIIVCVPTPLNKTKEPDISYIISANEKIAATLRPGQLVVLESTTYPGTTDELLLPAFEAKGLKLDEDFFLAFSPERVDPGNPQYQTRNIPKVVGGVTDASTEVAASLYGAVVELVHKVSSARVAETAKLLENTFRAVNIGLVNELARLCYRLDIDTWEVIRAAATKPFGFMPFFPGPGIGGHCLVGDETTIVREPGKERGQVAQLGDLFEKQGRAARVRRFPAGGGDVIYKPSLEALSVDMETRQPEWRPVRYLFRRKYEGPVVTIVTSDNRRITVTDQHPMLVCGADGQLQEVFARDVAPGDRVPIHHRTDMDPAESAGEAVNPVVDLIDHLTPEDAAKIRVKIAAGSWREHREALKSSASSEAVQEYVRQDYIPLELLLALESSGALRVPHESLLLRTGRGPSATSFPAVVHLTPGLARLIGYFLAEGCITRERGLHRVRFTFNRDETEFVDDVRALLLNELGVRSVTMGSRTDHVTHIRVGSALFGWLLDRVLACGARSTEMRVPDALMQASTGHHRELLKGLLRGDGDVYVKTGLQSYRKNDRSYTHRNASAEVGYFSSSPMLFQQTVYLLQEMGFTPTFKRTKPHLSLKGRQLERMNGWLGGKGERLNEYFAERRRTSSGRTFKQLANLTTVPVKSVRVETPCEPVDVYSLEVDDTHTFAASYGIYVHNCIPLDPHYLSWKARMHGFEARFIGLAEEVNSRMPHHVVELVTEGLNRQRKAVNGARILVLGVAYKRDINDVRESPALSIIDLLLHRGAEVVYHDPYVAELHLDGEHGGAHDVAPAGGTLSSVEFSDEELKRADCVLVITDHKVIDYAHVVRHAALVVDTRNVTAGLITDEAAERVIRL